MSVIIRLQGLPWSASALDIRHFFKGLTIPAGGVHIIGGERGDAFIAFGSDEDARQAMMRNMGPISGSPIQLFLSSKSEMQTVIEEARTMENIGAPPVTVIGQTPVVPASQSNVGQFQGQGFPGPHGAANQRLPQNESQGLRDPQGQFPVSQGFQVLGHMQGPVVKESQYGFPGDRGQGTNPQNFPGSSMIQSPPNQQFGFVSDSNRNNEGRFPPNQSDIGNYGYPMDTDYSDNQQWQELPDTAQDIAGQHHFADETAMGRFGTQPISQRPDRFPPNSNITSRDGQFPMRQQPFPLQGVDQMQKPDTFPFNQQNTFGQDGMQPGPDPTGQFLRSAKSGMPIRPGPPGFEESQIGGPAGPRQGHVPRNLQEDISVLPAPVRPEKAPLIENRPPLMRNQEAIETSRAGVIPDRVGVIPEEGKPPHIGGSMQAGPIGLGRGRGMLPTPNVPQIGQQPPPRNDPYNQFNDKPFVDEDAMEHGRWPGYDDDDINRSNSDRGDPNMEMRNDPDFRRHDHGSRGRGRGQFSDGGDSDLRNNSRSGMRPFELPGGRRFDMKDRGFEDSRRFEGSRDGRFDGPPGPRGYDEHKRFDENADRGYEDPHSFENSGIRDFNTSQNEGFERSGGRGFGERGFPGRGFEPHRGRGNETSRGRGFDRSRGRGFEGTESHMFGPPGNRDYGHHQVHHGRPDYNSSYPEDDGTFDDIPPDGGALGNLGFGDDHRGHRDFVGPNAERRGFDSRRGTGRGRMDAGRSRVEEMGMDTDRRWNGPREDVDTRSRDRNWRDNNAEMRNSKGLLGDAPPGLLPSLDVQVEKKEEKQDSRFQRRKEGELQRDRDRRGYSDRRDQREEKDRSREDRSSRRLDRRSDERETRGRDRSSERHSRSRSERDHRRGRSKDQEREKERERSSTRDRESRSQQSLNKTSESNSSQTKDSSNEKKTENEKAADTEKKTQETEKKNSEVEKSTQECEKPSSGDSQMTDYRFIYVKNLPRHFNYKDIRRFFVGCEIPYDGLKIINDLNGQRTGEAYVKFANNEAGRRALLRNGEKIFGNTVSVISSTSKDFEKQIDSQKSPEVYDENLSKMAKVEEPPIVKPKETSSLIIMMRGLPPTVKREDIVNFFNNVRIADNGDAIFIEYDSRNQATGIAFVETASVHDFKIAMGYDCRPMGQRQIRLSAARREEMDTLIKKQQEMFQRQTNRNFELANSGNMPVSGQGPLGHGGSGLRPPLFAQTPGRGPQPLMSIGFQGQPRNGPAPDFNQQRQQPGDKTQQGTSVNTCVHIQGLPMLATYKDIRDFFPDLNIVPRGIQIVHDGLGKPMGEGFVEFSSVEDRERALRKDKTSMGRHIVAVKPISKPDMMERVRSARLLGIPPGQGPSPIQQPQSGPGNPNSCPKPIPAGVLNRQFCYVRCQNFPANVTVGEILSFFHGFQPVPESIRLHFSADGTPTGNAVVGFQSLDEAQKAIQELSGKMCRHSIISLQPVQM